METGEQIGEQDVQIRILEETGNHAFISNTIILVQGSGSVTFY